MPSRDESSSTSDASSRRGSRGASAPSASRFARARGSSSSRSGRIRSRIRPALGLGVRRVDPPRELPLAAVRLRLLAPERKERPHDAVLAPRSDPPRRAARHDAVEDRLDLVRGRVAGGAQSGAGRQGVAELAQLRLCASPGVRGRRARRGLLRSGWRQRPPRHRGARGGHGRRRRRSRAPGGRARGTSSPRPRRRGTSPRLRARSGRSPGHAPPRGRARPRCEVCRAPRRAAVPSDAGPSDERREDPDDEDRHDHGQQLLALHVRPLDPYSSFRAAPAARGVGGATLFLLAGHGQRPKG